MPDLRLQVNGKNYGGWTSMRVTRGIECIAGGFELAVVERWAGQPTPVPILEEDECTLTIDGKPVITGYVDCVRRTLGKAEHTLTVTGRDRTGDLVDCSADLAPWEFLGVALRQFVERVAKPFGIKVTMQRGLTLPAPLAKISISPGDSAFSAIEKACRMAAVLPVSDGLGGLILTRAGTGRATTAIVEGENLEGGSSGVDATSRFRRYLVMGQNQGTDELAGEEAASVSGSAQDAGVRRSSRVLIVRPEGAVTPEHARVRAEWEAKVRAGRAGGVMAKVPSWTQGDGTLWPVNARVAVRSPYLRVSGEMLITQATYEASKDAGTSTSLQLQRPDAFLPEPVVPKDGTFDELNGGV
jgi:prophage tail gpP-like protein